MLMPAQIKTKLVRIETEFFFFFSLMVDSADVYVCVLDAVLLPVLILKPFTNSTKGADSVGLMVAISVDRCAEKRSAPLTA